MRANLRYLLLDNFDPDTGELALRVGLEPEDPQALDTLRLRLHLGRSDDALAPLRRELQTHVQMPLPALWDHGLKTVIHAIEAELKEPGGRDPGRYRWVQTQMLHPTDERRGTLKHPIPRQVEILWDWAQRLDQEGDSLRAIELIGRMLLLAPQHVPGLQWLASLLRQQGLVEETLGTVDRLLQVNPADPEALLQRGEALLHLERPKKALEAFLALLKVNPMHPLGHLGAAQAKSLMGADPCPHLDAALELDGEATRSVLLETFDHRILVPIASESMYAPEDLPAVLGVSAGEVRAFLQERGLPATGTGGLVRESELNRWVTLQNRYQLLPTALHWLAPTPRHIPELPEPQP